MPKKIIQDIQSKGVKITRISKEDISTKAKPVKQVKPLPFDPGDIKPTTNNSTPEQQGDYFEKIEKEIKKENHIHTREAQEKIFSSTPKINRGYSNSKKKIFVWVLIFISIIGIYFIANLFENTRITIVQKKQTLNLNKEQFSASIEENAPIVFQLMIVSDTESRDITLSDSQNVSTKAHGEAIFYNEYSTKPQKLLINTKISDSSGKTYQTDKAINIPGYTTTKSKVVVPGQISVGITSFLPGDEYNGSPSDFSINGFKGTDKGKKIYAKLKSPLSGGAQGVVYKPTPQESGTINAMAATSFKNDLLKKVNAQVPEGYILYPNAMRSTYSVEDNILSKTPNAKVKLSGTISSIIFKEQDLTNALIKKLLPSVTPVELKEIKIADISKLAFNFVDPNQSINKDLKSVSFNLTGDINPIWHQDVATLVNSLVGVDKSTLESVWKSDPGIAQASVKIFPPWKKYLPSNQSKIHINLQ